MNFDFSSGRITMVIGPVDMRAGYERLSLIAASLFGIDVDAGNDFVIFVSRQRHIAKMIWADGKGRSMLTRRLNIGRLEHFLAQGNETLKNFSVDDLMSFLDGKRL